MNTQTHTQQQPLPVELLFTLDKAQHLSRRCGWAWSLTRQGRRIQSGSGMFGYPATPMLTQDTSRYGDSLTLSAPPHSGFLSLETLLPELTNRGIRKLNLPKINSPWWVFGSQQENSNGHGIQIRRYDLGQVGHQLFYGPFTLASRQRPWVCCISAATIFGGEDDLASHKREFGHHQRIHQRIISSHALVTDNSLALNDYRNSLNAAGGELALFPYEGEQKFQQILTQMAQLQLPTLTLVVSHHQCQKLLRLGLVDELLISYRMLECTAPTQPDQPVAMPGWQVSDTHLLSQGVQVEMIKRPF